MKNIFDCSNSEERPAHRGGGGPKQNDILRYLSEHAAEYGYQFVDDANKADIIITNDVYPKYILDIDRPRVKRMCSPFWRSSLLHRNILLNEAAKRSNLVIFISEYSKNSYQAIYGQPEFNNIVIHHWVDDKVFFNKFNHNDVIISSATDWSREEKRVFEFINLALANKHLQFKLIGKCNITLPKNVSSCGYISNPMEMADVLNDGSIFVNLTYRDAATKTVPQALSCCLPVLYSTSGGVKEYVGEYGLPIDEPNILGIEASVQSIGCDYTNSLAELINKKLSVPNLSHKFNEMLINYFKAFDSVLNVVI